MCVICYNILYIIHRPGIGHTRAVDWWRSAGQTPCLGRRDDTVLKPASSLNFSIRVFRVVPFLLKLDKQFPFEQFQASRAIRAESTSVSRTLSPSECPSTARRIEGTARGGGISPYKGFLLTRDFLFERILRRNFPL